MMALNTRSLAHALESAQPRDPAQQPARGADPFVDRLATALTLVPAADAADFDDADDELDLPMLVQQQRPPVVQPPLPPTMPAARGREGRAALIGFGLGLILLVPIGMTLSSRLPEQLPAVADASTIPALMPATITTTDNGIRTTRRATQPVTTNAAFSVPEAAVPVIPREAPPALASPVAVAAAPQDLPAAPAPAQVAPPPPPPVQAPPKPDRLAIAAALVAQGDILAARAAIADADLDANPLAVFALAETFDPNMLAAWNAHGVEADAARARQFYRRALDNGVMKARQRLDALQ